MANESNNFAKVLHFYGLLEQDNEYKIVCPFHEDVNASMKINLNDGSFYCFGCGATGDAMKFVALVNKGDDNLTACIKYNKILGSKDVQHIVVKKHTKSVTEDKQLYVEACDYYFNLSRVNWTRTDCSELDYMMQRGFDAKTLNKFGAKLTYNFSYPIIFPMYDMGEFRGWVCRTTNKEVEKKRKYLYNEGFSRRNTLVGNYDSRIVTVVEGYMDRMKLMQLGMHKVVAILGWKITENQISKLKDKGVKTIVSALDNDKCGINGTNYLKQFFEVVRFQYPPGVKDAGDLDTKAFNVAMSNTRALLKGRQ